MADITLSNVAPDFSDLVAQLQNSLATKDTWRDRLTSSTGQTLIEMIASVGAFNEFSIESAFQEAFPSSAKNDSSLYAAAQFLGVRLTRKNPAEASITMSAIAPLVIPPLSQFSGAGTFWFNRDALSVSTTPQTFTLYQGKIITTSTAGVGTDFQAFVSPEKDFTVSNQDLAVSVASTSVPSDASGLWGKLNAPGCQNLTLPDGRLLILFGNDLYGTKPANNQIVTITYAVTQGVNGNNINTLAKKVQYTVDPTITGTFTTLPSGGGNEPGATVYKNVTPALFGAFDSSVTASQYKKLPLTYPGVLDAITFAQREVNPRALPFMNVVKVCLLTQTPFNDLDWANFEKFFLANTMYAVRIIREDPIPYPISITAKVLCKNFSNLSDIQTKCQLAMANFFALRQGIIGSDTYRSDIIETLYATDSNIEHIILTNPKLDTILTKLNVDAPKVTRLAGGTLPAGTYDYSVSYTSTLGGESAPRNYTTVTAQGNGNTFKIDWEGLDDAVSYKVWGRVSPVSLGLLYTLNLLDPTKTIPDPAYPPPQIPDPNHPGQTIPDPTYVQPVIQDPLGFLSPLPTLTFTDTGTIQPTGSVPALGTISTYYPSLVANNIDAVYNS